MAKPRVDLQEILEMILGSTNVYFQPPETIKMSYPCIVYERDSAYTSFADDVSYSYAKRYQITHIDKNPDSTVPDKIAKLPFCTYSRFFKSDNLNHDVFNLYF